MIFLSRFFLILSTFLLVYLGVITFQKADSDLQESSTKPRACDFQKVRLPIAYQEHFAEGILGSLKELTQSQIESHLHFEGMVMRPDYESASYHLKWKDQALACREGEKLSFDHFIAEESELQSLSFCVESEKRRPLLKVYENETLLFEKNLPLKEENSVEKIGDFLFDKNLFIRQKISFVGQDLFLSHYGLEEYPEAQHSYRLDFFHLNDPYFYFVQEQDLLVWKEGKWQKIDGDTKPYPLMQVEKVDSKLITLNVWNISGSSMRSFVLPRSADKKLALPQAPLKFVGAKSKGKWWVQSQSARLSLKKGDWILHLDSQWKKIETLEVLDHYLKNIQVGELLIITDLKQDGKSKFIEGELFNSLRTKSKHISLPVDPIDLSKKK